MVKLLKAYEKAAGVVFGCVGDVMSGGGSDKAKLQ